MIFAAAARAVFREFATGHCDEWAGSSIDDLEITDDKRVIERNGAKRSQSIIRILHQFDAYLGYLHVITSPIESYFSMLLRVKLPEQSFFRHRKLRGAVNLLL